MCTSARRSAGSGARASASWPDSRSHFGFPFLTPSGGDDDAVFDAPEPKFLAGFQNDARLEVMEHARAILEGEEADSIQCDRLTSRRRNDNYNGLHGSTLAIGGRMSSGGVAQPESTTIMHAPKITGSNIHGIQVI